MRVNPLNKAMLFFFHPYEIGEQTDSVREEKSKSEKVGECYGK